MGSDLSHMSRLVNERDGIRYRQFRRQVAELLGLKVQHNVMGPGDHQGATDEEIIEALVLIPPEYRLL